MAAVSVERATCFTYSASPVDFPIGGTMFVGQSNPTNLYRRQSLVLAPSVARAKSYAVLRPVEPRPVLAMTSRVSTLRTTSTLRVWKCRKL